MLRPRHARSTRHLSAGALEALYDGEASLLRRWGAWVHLLRCRRCRARAATHRHEIVRAHRLLTFDAPNPDTGDAWQVLGVRTRTSDTQGRSSRLPWIAGATLVAAGLTILATIRLNRPRPDLVAQMIQMSSQNWHTPKGPHRRDIDFAHSLARLEAQGALRRISDVCCADRDGEGPADDGVLTVALAGGRSPVVIMYEDTRRSGYFRPGDAVLMVSRPEL